jgi:hypothetical protein
MHQEYKDIIIAVAILVAFMVCLTVVVGLNMKGNRHAVRTLVSVQLN